MSPACPPGETANDALAPMRRS